jgi:anti-sigma factor RsiW
MADAVIATDDRRAARVARFQQLRRLDRTELRAVVRSLPDRPALLNDRADHTDLCVAILDSEYPNG